MNLPRVHSAIFRISLLLSLLSGCAITINEVKAPVALPATFSRSGSAITPAKWWLSFNDRELNQLIEHALSDNFTLLATYNRLEQARQIAIKSGADLIPAISGNATASQLSTNLNTTNKLALGLAASYEVDLWGRIRANLNASQLDVAAAREDLAAAAISLTAEISSTWYKLIEQRQQLQLLDAQIKTNRANTSIVTIRFQLGQATAADVFQQNQLLQSVLGNKLNVIAAIAVLHNQLSVLTGRSPGTFTLPARADFPALPQLPVTGLSIDLIKRRPDLRKAYVKVQAADQRVAAAIAERFPKLSLSTGIETQAPDLQSLFNNWLGTLMGNLVLPLVDGGRRIAEVERNQALTREAINSYATALLTAIKEVENALAQEQQQAQLVSNLHEQIRLADLANTQIRSRYIYGAMDFLRVLSSELSLQSLQRSYLLAQQQLLDYRINLYRALSGNFDLNINTRQPQPTLRSSQLSELLKHPLSP